MEAHMKHIAFAMFIVLALVTACQSSESTPTPTEIPPAPTAGVPTAASTAAPTATPSLTPTTPPTPTLAPSPAPATATPTAVPGDIWVSATDGLNLRAQSNVTASLVTIVT